MAITFHTLTGNVKDLLAFDFVPQRVGVTVETNLPDGEAPVDLTNNRILLGGSVVKPNVDGSFLLENLIDYNSTDVNPSGIQYRISITYTNAATRKLETVTFGWFNITADGDLSDLIPTSHIDPEWVADTGVSLLIGTEGSDTAVAIDRRAARAQVQSPLLSNKILGGNIAPKPGYDWPQMWMDWDWDYWIKPQVDRAVSFGFNAIRIIGAPHAPLLNPAFAAWSQSADYSASSPDIIRRVGTHLYRLVTPGITASSGTGPSGTGTGITDGTATWDYAGEAPPTITQADYDAHWVQLADYCSAKGLALYPALCDMRAFSAVSAGDFTNPTVVAGLVSTATALSDYACIIGFDVFQEGDGLAGRAWTQSRGYSLGDRVYTATGQGYIATTAGTSAASGTGPSGTGTGITDGTVVWNYDHEALMPSDVLSVYASLRAAVGRIPLTTSFAVGGTSFAFDDRDAWWTVLHTSSGGPDFIDLHIYFDGTLTPRDIDYLAFRTGKPFIIGEFGADQSLTSDQQLTRFTQVKPIFQRDGVRGGFVWALADQGVNAPARLAGIQDNTGYVRGSSPLSTTGGRRTALTGALEGFAKANPPTQYVPPNLLTPERARPVPSLSTLIGQSIGYWSVGTNTTRAPDPRGIGFKCVAGGTATRAFVGAQSVDPIAVTPGLAYQFAVLLQSQGGGRSGIQVFIEWVASDKTTTVGSSSIVTGSDAPDTPTMASVDFVAPVGAAYAQPTVVWPASQATDEVHLILWAYFGQPQGYTNAFSGPIDPFMSDRLDVGQETMHRMFITTTSNLNSGQMRLTFFTARKWDTITKIRTLCGTAAGATPTLCRIGLFTVASNLSLTLVASTTNDTALWSAGTTAYEKALTTPYAVAAGTRYAIGLLCVTAAAAPTVYVNNGGATAELGIAPRLSALVLSLSDLPSSVAAGSLNDNSTRPYAVLLP